MTTKQADAYCAEQLTLHEESCLAEPKCPSCSGRRAIELELGPVARFFEPLTYRLAAIGLILIGIGDAIFNRDKAEADL